MLQTVTAKFNSFGTRYQLRYRAVYLQNALTCNHETSQKSSFSDRKLFNVVFRVISFSEFDYISILDQKMLVFIAFRYNFSVQFDFDSTNNHTFFSRNPLFNVVSNTFYCLPYAQCYVIFTDKFVILPILSKLIIGLLRKNKLNEM